MKLYFIGLILIIKSFNFYYNYIDEELDIMSVLLSEKRNVEIFNISYKQITSIPKEIGNLIRLKELYINCNCLILLPKEIGNLINLKILDISDNRLTSIPKEIGNLINLKELYINNNQLIDLPKKIGALKNLRILSIENNHLITVPKEIGNLINLKILDISNNKLTLLPEEIGDLINLKELYINNNQLIDLPKKIGALKNLRILSIDNNHLITVPKEIGNLKLLEGFGINGNQLTSLPKEICNLKKLKGIGISNNKLITLPKEIGTLQKLKKLGIDNNYLIELPKEIGNLKYLEFFSADNNKIKSLPKELGNLKKLKEFYIKDNQIILLPEEIGNLRSLEILDISNNKIELLFKKIGNSKKLKKLYINDNRLTLLPKEIGNLKKLKEFYSNNNYLTTLPKEVKRLSNNLKFMMNIKNNPLIEYGDNGSLGFMDLYDIFGWRIILSENLFLKILFRPIYKKISRDLCHWNFDILRNIKLEKIPKGSLSGQEILDMWNVNISRYQVFENDHDESFIESYIKTLYEIDDSAFQGVRIYSNCIDIAKDLIEAIFKKIMENILCSVENFENDTKSYISIINESMKYCGDRQLAEFHMVYTFLYCKSCTLDSFESFIKNQISILKNNMFDMIVTPSKGLQNVHTLNTWKYTMKDEIGLDIEYETTSGILENDMFDYNPCKVIKTFYDKFTPNYVIKKLVEIINGSNDKLMKSGAFLMDKINQDEKYAEIFFEFEDQDKVVDLIPNGIKYRGVKEILLQMNILKENKCIINKLNSE